MRKENNMKTFFPMIGLLTLTNLMPNAGAQEVFIPDPDLNAAIRATLSKPTGALTAQDMLSLTNLGAFSRRVRSLEGLGAAQNLTTLNLNNNQLTNFSFRVGLTNLTTLWLDGNELTSLTLPAGLMRLTTLVLDHNPLLKTVILSEQMALRADKRPREDFL
jgi:internalin A